jgi:histidine kinase
MKSIRLKLLFSYLAVLGVGVIVILIAVYFTAPMAYSRHLAGGEAPLGQGQGLGAQRGQTQFISFRAGVFEALGYAALAATLAALTVGIFFSRRIVFPLRQMMQASQRISDGHYQERVIVTGQDELAQLAVHFNQMAEKLEQTETMRRRLIGDVSHELRTPLTAIKGSMEGLIDGVLPANNETFEQIFKEADRLGRLVEDLQEISRVEARAYQMEIRPQSVAGLAQTVARRLQHQFDKKQITLTLSLSADLPPVFADEDRAIQILTNLTANAMQYTPTAGAVTISAQHEAGLVRFSIQDTGAGIQPEHLALIFDRFYRVDKSRSRQAGGGSGIGLTIARHLVEAQGGRIWVESAGTNQGSTFYFTLPCAI